MNEVNITVLMPVYNMAGYIGEAIRSVLGQDADAFELLVVDDGSTDDTAALVRSFRDPRIRLVQTGHNGIVYALNTGLGRARGRYIARFDADDICQPGRLRKQADFLDRHPGYVLCGSDAEYITEQGEHLFHFTCAGHADAEIREQLFTHCPVIHSAVMYRRDPVLQAGGYPSGTGCFEDHLLWVRLAAHGKFHNLPEALIRVRFNPGSATIDEKWRGRRFRQLKQRILKRGSVTGKEAAELAAILARQGSASFKHASYHALCAKKFLADNYRPAEARKHLSAAIRMRPARLDNYALYLLSYFPAGFIGWVSGKKTVKYAAS